MATPRATAARPAVLERNPELLRFACTWDRFRKLLLARPKEVQEPFNAIQVYKDKEHDCFICDRRRQNAREAHLHGDSRLMPAGASIQELHVSAGGGVQVCSDDLVDFFPACDVSDEHARTNGLALRCTAADFRGTRA